MGRLGQFEEVRHPRLRAYVRDYWRFLLNWGPPPVVPEGAPSKVGRWLRLMARTEVLRYREHVTNRSASATILPFVTKPKPPEPPLPPPAMGKRRKAA